MNRLEMPDVFEFLHDLYVRPETHHLVATYLGYRASDQRRPEEAMNTDLIAGPNVKSFDNLDPRMQALIMRSHGCETYQEYEAYCKTQANRVN